MKKIRFLSSCAAVMLAAGGAGLMPAMAQVQQGVVQTDSLAAATERPAPPDTLPHVDPNLVRERLAKLQKEVPLTYNNYSHGFVEYFTFRKAAFTKTMLERINYYFPIYEKYLAQYGLPDELKYLSLIESGLNPRALSYASAGGLWQFMPRTATLDFGLRMDKYVDERFDPEKSTEAACKYFRQLYRIFGDWEMVLASYNTGPGNVKRAIRRSGNRTDFWGIYNYLPQQTREYVPQYVGIRYMMEHAADHGIRPELIENPMPFDTVQLNGYTNLETFAALSLIPYETIQKLNPHILTSALPAHTREFPLRVPSDSYAYIAANRRAILDSAGRNPLDMGSRYAGNRLVGDSTKVRKYADVTVEEEPEEEVAVVERKTRAVYHHVRRGETLGRIADRHNVSLASLKSWNRLGRTGAVRAGQKLVIYKETVVASAARQTNVAPDDEDRASRNEVTRRLKAKAKFHTVRRGDTLWSIVQRYQGLTVNELKRMNNIRGNNVRPGMKIRVG